MEFFVISIIKAAIVAFVLLTTLAYLQWVERKVIAHIQVRLGPSRVGPHGLLQPLADVIKLITKEDLLPPYVNKFVYLLAPFLAVSSMGVYGVALAGWASNNKYALLGGLRSSAQMISYELPLSLAIAAPLLLVNTLSLREIVQKQAGSILHWNVLPQIVSFFVFVIAGFAETNRVPFDLPEAENELVAGFHTEYSSMQFAAFFMAEYANMLTITCITAVPLFRGMAPPFPPAGGAEYFFGQLLCAFRAVA